MLHFITKAERTYGFIFDPKIINFETDHALDGIQVEFLSGDIITYYGHVRGFFHSHRSIHGRLDGLSDAFDRMISNMIDINVIGDGVYIREI